MCMELSRWRKEIPTYLISSSPPSASIAARFMCFFPRSCLCNTASLRPFFHAALAVQPSMMHDRFAKQQKLKSNTQTNAKDPPSGRELSSLLAFLIASQPNICIKVSVHSFEVSRLLIHIEKKLRIGKQRRENKIIRKNWFFFHSFCVRYIQRLLYVVVFLFSSWCGITSSTRILRYHE